MVHRGRQDGGGVGGWTLTERDAETEGVGEEEAKGETDKGMGEIVFMFGNKRGV